MSAQAVLNGGFRAGRTSEGSAPAVGCRPARCRHLAPRSIPASNGRMSISESVSIGLGYFFTHSMASSMDLSSRTRIRQPAPVRRSGRPAVWSRRPAVNGSTWSFRIIRQIRKSHASDHSEAGPALNGRARARSLGSQAVDRATLGLEFLILHSRQGAKLGRAQK